MNSRVSWSAESIEPSVRERAEAAARRAGMSLNDWLNSSIGEASPPDLRAPPPQRPMPPGRETREVADIHQRLDAIARQIDQITGPAPRNAGPGGNAGRGEPAVARQLNDAISRLDVRLSQISNPAPARQAELEETQHNAELVERAAAQVYRPSPPLSPVSLEAAIAEISARQKELDNAAPRPAPPRNAPAASAPVTAPAAGPDFSSLERHLFKITSQIEALRPDGIEQSIAAFRGELSEIRHAITEAMPRRAIESIENEIRSLTHRIDDNRQNGIDGQALAGIERALNEIREVLRSLKPAEQLAGYDEAIRNLGAKLDMILRANDDPSTMQQLEGAITALRAIASNVASNDALARLSDDVHTLASKVDQLSRSGGNSDSFAMLEQRIAALASTMESRERPGPREGSEQIEGALRTLTDRIDRMPVGSDNESAFVHLEQRVTYLLDRLEASADPRGGNLGRVEHGLQEVLRHLETQQATFAALARNSHGAGEPDGGVLDTVKRDLSDLRSNQIETNRRTQDSLEVVHNTLGHVVDRLGMIEGDLRGGRGQPVAPPPEMPPARRAAASQPAAPRAATPPHAKPELPNPAAQEQFVAAPREFQVAPPIAVAHAKAAGDILGPPAGPPRVAIEPDLPPDHPLEPGTRPAGRPASPSERIAASESAISGLPAGARGPTSTSSFIAAARRAAQAAAAAAPDPKAGRRPLNNAREKVPSTVTSKIRSLLVGASVVVIVLGTFKMAMTLLDLGTPSLPFMENASESSGWGQPPAEDAARPAAPDAATPAMTPPEPAGRQSFNGTVPNAADSTASVAIPQNPVAPSASAASASDITGTTPAAPAAASRPLAMVQVPPTEQLPDAIGSGLRAAALKGDAAAAYEIGLRFAEGKGVASNPETAAKWYDRAAQAGVVPAVFRLGTLYEKGLGVTKDIDAARRYYVLAAERGNAKAMHNLAVLDADGSGKGANYAGAAQWFRKAAERGIADSQFNLGILYARGIGVEQNLPESFKWFSLAAAQGDADAARKRDDVAKRLDAQSLAAAKLAIQTFAPEPQPDDAINVRTPPGGWDGAPAQATTAKPATKPATIKRASR